MNFTKTYYSVCIYCVSNNINAMIKYMSLQSVNDIVINLNLNSFQSENILQFPGITDA